MKSRLKVLALGGERFPSKDIIKDLFLIMPEIQIFNIYGTSELSSWASIYQVQKDLIVTTTFKGSDWVPIGEALSQTVIEVRDDFGGLVSNGVGQVWSGRVLKSFFFLRVLFLNHFMKLSSHKYTYVA